MEGPVEERVHSGLPLIITKWHLARLSLCVQQAQLKREAGFRPQGETQPADLTEEYVCPSPLTASCV